MSKTLTACCSSYCVNIRFTHNFRERPVLEHSGVRIRILDATPSGLSYSLEQER